MLLMAFHRVTAATLSPRWGEGCTAGTEAGEVAGGGGIANIHDRIAKFACCAPMMAADVETPQAGRTECLR